MQAEEAVVQNLINNYFTLKGYDFPYVQKDLEFPIELGDTLTIESEGITYFPSHSYQVFFLLKSPKTGQSQLFTSRVINNEETEVIEEVEKISEDIKRWTYDGYNNFNCYSITVLYHLKLEGGSSYTLRIDRQSNLDSRTEAEKICASIEVSKGDLISLGKGTYIVDQFTPLSLGEYGFHPKIYNQRNELLTGDEVILLGSKRASNVDEGNSNREMTIKSIFRKSSYRCYFSAICYGPPMIIFNNFGKGLYFNYKADIDLKKFQDHPLIYQKYYDKDGQRYYQFKLVAGDKSHNIDLYYKKIDPFTFTFYYEGLF